jgi:hypothetical protein
LRRWTRRVAPGAPDDRHLAREPLLDDELGLEPSDELVALVAVVLAIAVLRRSHDAGGGRSAGAGTPAVAVLPSVVRASLAVW